MSIVYKSVRAIKKQSTILHKFSKYFHTDRSFRLANVADLYVAQELRHKIQVTNEHYFAGFQHTSSLKSRDLAKQVVIDLSHEQGYRRGHIKGAVNLPLEKFDFTKKVDIYGGIHLDDVTNAMTSLGVSNDTSEVILYDNSGLLASRLYFVLRYFGFTNIRILNGGWRAWIRSGFPVDEEIPQIIPSKNLDLKDLRTNSLKKNSQMVVEAKNKNTTIIDTRRPDAFEKVNIPGSINIPIENFMEDGMFSSVDDIRKLLDRKGVSDSKPITLYSSRGLTASVAFFSLNMAGIDTVSIYDGGIYSWLQNGEQTISQEAREFLSGSEL